MREDDWKKEESDAVQVTSEATLQNIMIERSTPNQKHPQHLCLDAGYDYDAVYETVRAHHYLPHIRPNQHNRIQMKPLPEADSSSNFESTKQPRRWVVERLHSWIKRSRRLLVRWEKLDFTSASLLTSGLCPHLFSAL